MLSIREIGGRAVDECKFKEVLATMGKKPSDRFTLHECVL
jgi:hypothetical protein